MQARFVLFPTLWILLNGTSALAGNLYVDPAGACDGRSPCFTTVQAAIDAALAGDTVLVGPGTYVETINFRGKAITVTGEQGPDLTIIDGNQNGSVVTFASGEGGGSVLSGLTIRNGRAMLEGGGVSIGGSSPSVIGNNITSNTSCDGNGIAIGFGSPLIQGNVITNNTRSGCSGGNGGGGILIRGASTAQILDNLISNNDGGNGVGGGGVSLFAVGNPTIRNNIITGNRISTSGGGIGMVNVSDADIVQNIIADNTAFQGGGIAALVPSGSRGPLVVNNTIVGNNSQQGSGAFIDGFDDRTLLVNNIIIGSPGQTPAYCGNFTASVPMFRFNNVFNPDGTPPYGGNCTDQTGLSGNISADPSFVDLTNSDFHLQDGSPCIDAGDNTAPRLPEKDLDGNDRIINGVVDMGVYEFSASAPLARKR